MFEDLLKNVWPEWKVVRQLGRGSFGVVYEAVRTDHDLETHAAIKVISIPQSESEVDSLRSEGLTVDETTTYLHGVVDDFIREISLMESFKGTQNIVSVEDYKVVEKKDTIGWDIYIRMELLTPFVSYITDRSMSEYDVINLGIDMCTALELCEKRNVIHRDIKPENIFVNQFGDFKLGDFGIARKLENVTSGLSQKGTYNYMAPEIEQGRDYDKTVDIYALGLVLYRLCNNNRMPFITSEKQLLNPNERVAAMRRRLDGEPLPAPSNASAAMADLILKACAYDPSVRFQSATAMKKALIEVGNGTYQINPAANDATVSVRKRPKNADPDKTTSVRRAPKSEKKAAKQNSSKKNVQTFGKKKKSKAPLIITLIALLFVVVGGGIFAVISIAGGASNSSQLITETDPSTLVGDAAYSAEDQEKIKAAADEADAYALGNDYAKALETVRNALKQYPKSDSLAAREKEYVKSQGTQIKKDALDEAARLAADNDYAGAVNVLKEAENTIGADTELSAQMSRYEDTYVSDVVKQAQTSMDSGALAAAASVLDDALKVFPKNQKLLDQKALLGNSTPKLIMQACPPYESSGFESVENLKMAGTTYMNGFTLSRDGYALFNLDKKYSTFDFDIGHVDGTEMSTAIIQISLDGVNGEVIEVDPEDLPRHMSLDVKGISQMKIALNGYWVATGFVNASLSGSSGSDDTDYDPTEGKSLLLSVCPPYETAGYEKSDLIKMGGDNYVNGFTLAREGYALFNLEGKYSTIEFDFGHVDQTEMKDATIQFTLDGVTGKVIEAHAGDLPQHYSIDVTGVSQVKITTSGYWTTYGFANLIIE